MIGLIDCEASHRYRNFMPNLEIMKLSTYYKQKGMVKLILNEEMAENCEKIFLRKEYAKTPVPISLFLNKNVEFGGHGFTNDVYVPLNEEIEGTVPDFKIYIPYIREKVAPVSMGNCRWFLGFSNFNFLRLHNSTATQLKMLVPGRPLLLYDKNIFQENYFEQLIELRNRITPKHTRYYHPIIVNSVQQLTDLKEINLFSIVHGYHGGVCSTKITLNFPLVVNTMRHLVYEHKEWLSNFCLSCLLIPLFPKNLPYMEEKEFNQYFDELANSIYFALSYRIRLNPYYNFPYDGGEYAVILRAFARYLLAQLNNDITFYEFCNTRPKTRRQIILSYYNRNPYLWYLFSASANELYNKGGQWYGKFRN